MTTNESKNKIVKERGKKCCLNCNNIIDKKYKKLYCSDDCRVQYYKKKQENERVKRIKNQPRQYCKACGKVITKDRFKVYCSRECNKTCKNDYDNKTGEKIKKIRDNKKCRFCGKKLTGHPTKVYCNKKCASMHNVFKCSVDVVKGNVKICKMCHKELENGDRNQFCSDDCKTRYQEMIKNTNPKICIECGNEYWEKGKYCNDCFILNLKWVRDSFNIYKHITYERKFTKEQYQIGRKIFFTCYKNNYDELHFLSDIVIYSLHFALYVDKGYMDNKKLKEDIDIYANSGTRLHITTILALFKEKIIPEAGFTLYNDDDKSSCSLIQCIPIDEAINDLIDCFKDRIELFYNIPDFRKKCMDVKKKYLKYECGNSGDRKPKGGAVFYYTIKYLEGEGININKNINKAKANKLSRYSYFLSKYSHISQDLVHEKYNEYLKSLNKIIEISNSKYVSHKIISRVIGSNEVTLRTRIFQLKRLMQCLENINVIKTSYKCNKCRNTIFQINSCTFLCWFCGRKINLKENNMFNRNNNDENE